MIPLFISICFLAVALYAIYLLNQAFPSSSSSNSSHDNESECPTSFSADGVSDEMNEIRELADNLMKKICENGIEFGPEDHQTFYVKGLPEGHTIKIEQIISRYGYGDASYSIAINGIHLYALDDQLDYAYRRSMNEKIHHMVCELLLEQKKKRLEESRRLVKETLATIGIHKEKDAL